MAAKQDKQGTEKTLTEAIPLCDIISIYIFTSYPAIIKLTILNATT